MAQNDTIWAVRAGASGEVDHVFLKQSLLALGWPAVGSYDQYTTRDDFKKAVERAYPNNKPGYFPVAGGMLFRFRWEMKQGDLVVYPSKIDKLIHIGRISGDYYRDTAVDSHYCNLRPVVWSKSVPRTIFTQGALHEMNSALSVFKIATYASEITKALGSASVPAPPQPATVQAATVDDDDTITSTAVEIEENTKVFILKRLAQELKGHPFADFVAHLLGTMGFRSQVSPPGSDGGVDILAHKDELGFEPPIVKVQVKSTGGQIGAPDVRALYGTVQHGEFGLFVTLGSFTSQAQSFAKDKSNLRLIDGDQLVAQVLDHYEQFDNRYKGTIPLRRVYVPADLSD